MKAKLLAVVLLGSSWLRAQEPPLIEWTTKVGVEHGGDALPQAIHELPDGGYLLAWMASGVPRVAKVSPYGKVLWEKSWPSLGEPSPFFLGPNGLVLPARTPQGGLALLSVSESPEWKQELSPSDVRRFTNAFPIPGGGCLAFTVGPRQVIAHRLDTITKVWEAEIPGLVEVPTRQSVVMDGRGYWIGFREPLEKSHAVSVVRLTADGQIAWKRSIPHKVVRSELVLYPIGDGVFVMGNGQRDGTSAQPFDTDDGWLMKLDADGNLAWEIVFGGEADEQVKDMAVLPDGGCLVLGWCGSGQLTTRPAPRDWKLIIKTHFLAQVQPDGFIAKLVSAGAPDSSSPLNAGLREPGNLALEGRGAIVSLGNHRNAPRKRHRLTGYTENLEKEWDLGVGDETQLRQVLLPSRSGPLLLFQTQPTSPSEPARFVLTKLAKSGVTAGDLLEPLEARRTTRFAPGQWSLQTRAGWSYRLESSRDLSAGDWRDLLPFQGDGGEFLFPGRTDLNVAREFFRVRVEPP